MYSSQIAGTETKFALVFRSTYSDNQVTIEENKNEKWLDLASMKLKELVTLKEYLKYSLVINKDNVNYSL